jgi:type I restriction enzyme, S subunit
VGYPLVPLGKVVRVVGGGTPSRKESRLWKGEIPWASVKDLNDELDLRLTAECISREGLDSSAANLIPAGQVIIATRVGLGKVAVNAVPMAINQDLKALFCGEGLNPRYLAHALRHKAPQLISMGVGATVKGYNLKDLLGVEIPLPPLEEQRRIAALLDKADRLLRLRNEANEKAQRILPALFGNMFGDPETNAMGWEVKPLDCAATIQIGPFGSLLHQGDYIEGGIPLVNPKHIRNGIICPSETEAITPQKHAELKNYHLRVGDVVMGRRGEMGRCAVVQEAHEGFLCGTGSLIVRAKTGCASAPYLASLLSHRVMKARLERASLGLTLPNLNATIVKNLEVMLPPVEAQERFADALAASELILARQCAASDALSTSAATLRSRLFSEAM